MIKIAALVFFAVLLTSCAGKQYAGRCSALGFTPGTADHAACQMELSARFNQGLINAGAVLQSRPYRYHRSDRAFTCMETALGYECF